MKQVKITKNYIMSRFNKEDVDIFKNELFIYLLAKQKNISYIPKIIDLAMDNHQWIECPNLDDLKELDLWTKDFVKNFD